jgi:hypothetical protein
LWHGTKFEVMGKIMQQGVNRSFCGENATACGKGVHVAVTLRAPPMPPAQFPVPAVTST